MQKIIGAGVILQTPHNTYLFQERDHNTVVHPGKIAPFGGGIENEENAQMCAKREIFEELHLHINIEQLISIQLFEIPNQQGEYIHMFLLKDVNKDALILAEGKAIVELSKEEALVHENVTGFTKLVLGYL